MITINYSPVRMDNEVLTLEWNDPILTVSGDTFDLSELDDGDDATHEVLFTVLREGDDYEVTLRLPHGAKAPESTRFPIPVTAIGNGIINVPVYEEVV